MLGGYFGAPKTSKNDKISFFGAPKDPPKIFFCLFLSFHHFVLTLSFPALLYFLFYNDFKGFYDTLKHI